MKKQLLGIAVILFAIAVEVSNEGHFSYLTSGAAFVGLVIVLLGTFERGEK